MREPDFRNRLLKVLFCQGEPDFIPIVESGIATQHKERFLGRKILNLEDEVEFWYLAGFDLVPLEAGLRTIIDAAVHHENTGRFSNNENDHPKVVEAKAFAIKKLQAQSLTTRSEDGELRTWAPEGYGFINSIEDLMEFPWPRPEDLDYSKFYEIKNYLPDGMGVIPFCGAIFSCLMLMMGMETCLIAMMTGDRVFEELLKKVGEFQLRVVQILVDENLVDGIWINDDMGFKSRTLVNPVLYRRYTFPYYRAIKEIVKQKHLPLLLHSDGNITGILKDLVDIGFNAIHPIEPEAMDIDEARQIVGPGVCLIGNVGLSYPLGMGSPEDVKRETLKLIQKMGPGGGFCLSSANSIPEYIPYENWLAMREIALEFGRYPLKKYHSI